MPLPLLRVRQETERVVVVLDLPLVPPLTRITFGSRLSPAVLRSIGFESSTVTLLAIPRSIDRAETLSVSIARPSSVGLDSM